MTPEIIGVPLTILKNGEKIETIFEVRIEPCKDKLCRDGMMGCYNHRCMDHEVNRVEQNKWARIGIFGHDN